MATVLVLVSIVSFVASTHHGIGILPDSARYMQLVEKPYDAPLYAWALQAGELLTGSISVGARLLGLLFVCANTLLIWSMLSRAAVPAVAFAGTLLIITLPQFVGLHSVAMSEPLFIGLTLTSALLFCLHLAAPGPQRLAATGVALGLAMLTRFTAAPMALAISACLLLDGRRPLRRRLADIAVVAAASGVIFFSWVVGSEMTRGHAVGRDMEFSGNPDSELWLSGVETLTALLVPTAVPFALRLAMLAAALVFCVVVIWTYSRRLYAHTSRSDVRPLEWLPLVLGLFAVCYCLFMIVAVHIEANLPLNGRYALPLYVTTVMAMTVALGGRHRVELPRPIVSALLVLVAVMLAGNVVRSTDRIRSAYAEGIGYASTSWRSSPLVAFVRARPSEAVIYSNGPDALSYLTGRDVRLIPSTERRTGREDAARPLASQIAALREAVRTRDTYVVFADAIDWRFYALPEADLVASIPLVLFKEFPDGRIYVGGGAGEAQQQRRK